MRFAQLIREHQLIDIITVDGVPHVLVPETADATDASSASASVLSKSLSKSLPGCVIIPASHLHTVLANFLARGYSERFNAPYAEIVGLSAWTLVTYTLGNLPATKKQQFSHALMGTTAGASRPNENGMLARWQGKKLGRSAFLVPLSREAEAAAFLARWRVDYTREVVLRGH